MNVSELLANAGGGIAERLISSLIGNEENCRKISVDIDGYVKRNMAAIGADYVLIHLFAYSPPDYGVNKRNNTKFRVEKNSLLKFGGIGSFLTFEKIRSFLPINGEELKTVISLDINEDNNLVIKISEYMSTNQAIFHLKFVDFIFNSLHMAGGETDEIKKSMLLGIQSIGDQETE